VAIEPSPTAEATRLTEPWRTSLALYRHFGSRDELPTELVIDAYDDLADALRAATSDVPSRRPRA
jgi:hypothetical protein